LVELVQTKANNDLTGLVVRTTKSVSQGSLLGHFTGLEIITKIITIINIY